jgi:hypothetical protein
MFSLKLLEQKEKVQKECVILPVLVDAKLETSTFIQHPKSNFVRITIDIFRKEKRTRKEDVEDNEDIKVIFKVEGSKYLPSFIPWSQNSPEMQRSQTPEHVRCLRTVWKHHCHRRWNKMLYWVSIHHKVKVCIV